MFSFHKPRVYRSTEGCCICRAKSSSSRFTDSRKYEEDSVKCFNLHQPRQGEICNACVLLVKRYKRLPNGSTRHWGHVVDARVGPGMKSMTKFKKLRDETQQQSNVIDKVNKITSTIPEKFAKIVRKTKKTNTKPLKIDKKGCEGTEKLWVDPSLPLTPESFNSDLDDQIHNVMNGISITNGKIDSIEKHDSNGITDPNGKNDTNNENDKNTTNSENGTVKGSRRRVMSKPKKNAGDERLKGGFFDKDVWQSVQTCCGFVYEHPVVNAACADKEDIIPCQEHKEKPIPTNNTSTTSQKTDINFLPNKQGVILNSNEIPNGTCSEDNAQNFASKLNTANTFPILKKHHLYFKRQQDNFPVTNNISTGSNNLTTGTISTKNNEKIDLSKNKKSILHKIESETAGKIIKHSISKINSTGRLKSQDIIDISTIVRSKAIINPININKIDGKIITIKNKNNIIGPTTTNTKFSDNSSDSGFDENLQDRKSTSPIQEEEKKQTQIYVNRPIQKMFLTNGIQLQGQPENLILTGNEVAAKLLKSKRAQHKQVNLKLSGKLLTAKSNSNMSII